MKLNKINNKVAIIMGSQSDYPVMKDAEKILRILKINFEVLTVSAHRTPKRMFEFAENADKKGFAVIIAGAGGAGITISEVLRYFLMSRQKYIHCY